jgi:predicted AAA+ superfamily ATPase
VEDKGAYTEWYVLAQVKPLGFGVRYVSTNNSTIELDFVVQTAQGIVPVEVKAEENVRSKSLRIFAEKHPQLKAVRFSMKPYLDQGWMVNVPLYSVEGYFRKNCS